LPSIKVSNSTKVDSGGSIKGRKMGWGEERDEIGGMGAKLREDSIEMGSLSSS